jgi:glycosyltransferase involved in cell wall biosynthesis
MKLLYCANIRVPTEKAHGLQIMQNCEAFADAGADVTLWAARRWDTSSMRCVSDPWAHYGVKRNFSLRRLLCIDLIPLVPERTDALARLVFGIQLVTYTLAALLLALFARADVYYSRDVPTLLVLSLVKPRWTLAYEAHSLANGRGGRWLQRQTLRRCGTVFAVTRRLADDLIALGADPARTYIVHDGVRRERFANLPSQAEARQTLDWSEDAFIVGYVGRLHTMTMDKGVGLLVDALALAGGASIALVGGPDDMAEALKRQWIECGLPAEGFLYAGQVTPERVPLYLSAFDVCAMPFPWTEHFAYYASPIKLFEYMAARRAIVASDLPSAAEVVTDGESALLVPPSDTNALTAAITRLRDDPALCERLAARAYEIVMAHYTWEARAKTILEHISEPQPKTLRTP